MTTDERRKMQIKYSQNMDDGRRALAIRWHQTVCNKTLQLSLHAHIQVFQKSSTQIVHIHILKLTNIEHVVHLDKGNFSYILLALKNGKYIFIKKLCIIHLVNCDHSAN